MKKKNPLVELLENSQVTEVSGPGIDQEPRTEALKKEVTRAANQAGIRDVDIENTQFISQEFKQTLGETLAQENFYSPEGFEEILEEGYLPGAEIASRINDSLEKMPDFADYEVVEINPYMTTEDMVSYRLELQPVGEPGSLADTVKEMPQIYRSRQELVQGWQISGEVNRETYEELVE